MRFSSQFLSPQRFHPAVAAWLNDAFAGATPTQVQAWAAVADGGDVLVAAPTGSGKTLAAFLSALDELVVRGQRAALPDAVQVLYVSPLKALSNDIEKNLQAPLHGIRDRLFELGLPDVDIRTAVRTGDTSASARALMRKLPPHVLVTTPESLYILLTSESGRHMLADVRTVIVDELHALAGSKRGAHLMLSLERLTALCGRRPNRVGLSATVNPVDEVARYLAGTRDSQNGTRDPGPGTQGKADEARGAASEMSALSVASDNHCSDGGSREEADEARSAALDPLALPVASGYVVPNPGSRAITPESRECTIVDTGHQRRRDLALEVPRSPLDAVMANEVWSEIYDRLAELVKEHRTTLIFVNQRRLAERVARHLSERIGEEHVTAHHGSLAKEHRLRAEQRLKAGQLKALVATSSLELGIDIGDVDLVCQLGSPRWIAAFLQRVGRAGHAVDAVSKGRLFPLSLDDLVECTAMLDAIGHGELDRIRDAGAPLDVLAQQIVAEVSGGEWGEDELYALVRRAQPYRNLPRPVFDEIVTMLANGYVTRRGRSGAYLHHDTVNRRLRPRRGARLTAVTNAGVIPDQFDSDVVLLPEGHRIGTLNEDFAFESIPGDIFQLGNTAYRIAKIETGKVYVEDANGQPPTLPFWLGEALGRSDELSQAVSRLVQRVDQRLPVIDPAAPPTPDELAAVLDDEPTLATLPLAARAQLVHYLATAKAALGVLPTLDTLVFERFFDEVGDSHLVIHSPYGSRINKAWGLALRKRFCRQFNFELQASALEDSIVLSLGPTHSFPLEEVSRYLHPETAREVLVQALLDAPMFPTRWRWCASIALAVRRNNAGKRLPPQFQRSDAEDLLTVVFPDQVACAENLTGERGIPEHPLVAQTLRDCLHDTMDVDGFLALIARIRAGAVNVVCRDLTAPSPLSNAIINARPYAFLDDGEAEERRTRSVATQRLTDIASASGLACPDPAAIARVREEIWPLVRDTDELHDALVVHGFLTAAELDRLGLGLLDTLRDQRRATSVAIAGGVCAVAAERWPDFAAALPSLVPPAGWPTGERGDVDTALRELLRGRLELLGPIAEAALASPLGIEPARVRQALLALEGEGSVIRGHFEGDDEDRNSDDDHQQQWCERRLLARIHRYSREQRHARVQAVPPARFMTTLVHWHGMADAEAGPAREGDAALLAVIQQLEGWVAPAVSWERDLLPQRLRGYLPGMLDSLCASGRVLWWRPPPAAVARRGGPLRSTPITLIERAHLVHWRNMIQSEAGASAAIEPVLDGRAARVRDALRSGGAVFLDDLEHDTGLLRTELETALGELVSCGLVACDTFAGLRALIAPASQRKRQGGRVLLTDVEHAGRWSLLRPLRRGAETDTGSLAEPAVEHVARVLLRRYGVVFRAVLAREQNLPSWRELHYVYRRMEARGEIRGGRFVSGFSGEQFALSDAAAGLRRPARGGLVAFSAADPLNLVGVLTADSRISALAGNRVALRDGVPVAAQTGGEVSYLQAFDDAGAWAVRTALLRRPRPTVSD